MKLNDCNYNLWTQRYLHEWSSSLSLSLCIVAHATNVRTQFLLPILIHFAHNIIDGECACVSAMAFHFLVDVPLSDWCGFPARYTHTHTYATSYYQLLPMNKRQIIFNSIVWRCEAKCLINRKWHIDCNQWHENFSRWKFIETDILGMGMVAVCMCVMLCTQSSVYKSGMQYALDIGHAWMPTAHTMTKCETEQERLCIHFARHHEQAHHIYLHLVSIR